MELREIDAPTRFGIGGHPIHPMLIPFPIAFLVGALVTDIVVLSGGGPFWVTASTWLLLAGWVSGLATALAGLIEFLSVGKARKLLSAYIHAATAVAAMVLAIINWYLREDVDPAATVAEVPPVGFALSIATVLILLVVGWFGGSLSYKHRIGVTPPAEEPIAPEPEYGRRVDERGRPL
jgi:uncharacterized membrane protein